MEEEYSCSIRFTWKIQHFSTLDKEVICPDTFTGGDYKWRIHIFPEGCGTDSNLSVYLHVADPETLPNGWTRPVKFSLSVINKVNSHTVKRDLQHTFRASEKSWGFQSFMSLDKLHQVYPPFLVRDTCTISVEVWFNEEKVKVEPITKDKFDSLFTDIQNRLKVETTSSSFTDKEICDAQENFETCLDMDLKSLVRSGKAPELKSALSLLLTAKAISDSAVDESTKFLANFDQLCEQYETAERDLSEAQEDENSVDELKTDLKQLSSKFMPARKQAEALDIDISRQEKLLAESDAKRVRLKKRLDELGEQATTWNQALLCAEQRMNISKTKKGKAEKVVRESQVPWESLKAALHSVNNGNGTADSLKASKTRARPAPRQSRNLRRKL